MPCALCTRMQSLALCKYCIRTRSECTVLLHALLSLGWKLTKERGWSLFQWIPSGTLFCPARSCPWYMSRFSLPLHFFSSTSMQYLNPVVDKQCAPARKYFYPSVFFPQLTKSNKFKWDLLFIGCGGFFPLETWFRMVTVLTENSFKCRLHRRKRIACFYW